MVRNVEKKGRNNIVSGSPWWRISVYRILGRVQSVKYLLLFFSSFFSVSPFVIYAGKWWTCSQQPEQETVRRETFLSDEIAFDFVSRRIGQIFLHGIKISPHCRMSQVCSWNWETFYCSSRISIMSCVGWWNLIIRVEVHYLGWTWRYLHTTMPTKRLEFFSESHLWQHWQNVIGWMV